MDKDRRERLKYLSADSPGNSQTIETRIIAELIADLEAHEEKVSALELVLASARRGEETAEAKLRWIPVEERLPDDHKDVLVLFAAIPEKLWHGIGHRTEGGWRDDFGDEMIVHFWMELPPKPEGEKG